MFFSLNCKSANLKDELAGQESDSIALSLHQRRLSPADDVELCVISLKVSSPKLPPLLRKMMPARMVVVSRTIRMAITTLESSKITTVMSLQNKWIPP